MRRNWESSIISLLKSRNYRKFNMIAMTLSELAKNLATDYSGHDALFSGISTDTRTLAPKNLFVAITGDNFDGHDYLAKAQEKGAVAALVNRKIESSLPQIIVPDTISALGKISEVWRDRFSLPLIGVTGSNGKTTLKNMIAAILRAACKNNAEEVLATEGNLNNNIGLPLNLVRLNPHHRYAVLEMGMNHFGEIEYLTKIAKPAVAIINNAAEAHLAGVGDVSGVAKAKGEIFSGLQKNGVAVLNKDDAHYDYWLGLLKGHHVISFALEKIADITATIAENQNITIQTPQGKISVALPLLGKHNMMNALAATAATLAIGIDLTAIKNGLESVHAAPGRMWQYTLDNGARIIDDTYNANPISLQAAVNTLAALSGKKILVLGDMKELGVNETQWHYDVGQKIRQAGIQHLFTFGKLSAETAKAFGQDAQHFAEREKLVAALQPYLQQDTTILIKGSRSMQMEKVVAGIIPKSQLQHTH